MITVIATGFDSSRRRDHGRQAAAQYETGSIRSQQPARDRDFLEELERQRNQPLDPARDADRYVPRPDDAAAAAAGSASSGRVGTTRRPPRRTYDADDLEIPSFLRRK